MRSVWFALALAAVAAPGLAEDAKAVAAPTFKVGDLWVYDETTEKPPAGFSQRRVDVSVERLNDATMTIGVKVDGSPTAAQGQLTGLDWSKSRVVDGKEIVTLRPFVFPMSVGQTWTVEFLDTTRRGNQLSDHVHRNYKVVGWQDVTTLAGAFHVLKVEVEGVDQAEVEIPATAVSGAAAGSEGGTTVSHVQRGGRAPLVRRFYEELYYAPQVGNYVKYLQEQYTPENVRVFRQSQALVSYKPGG